MSDSNTGFGSGILKGLKNLLFKEAPAPVMPAPDAPPAPAPPPVQAAPAPVSLPAGSEKDMKLKVYQLLENMNRPGCDFFEVWNAAGEMGGANSANIKAAYTSLKFADSTLTKAKLMETGLFYSDSLKKVLQSETEKRAAEKQQLMREKEQAKAGLDNDIQQLEQQIASLQQQLQARKNERAGSDDKFNPAIADIDTKIALGQQSVNSVLDEMQQVLRIIEQDLN